MKTRLLKTFVAVYEEKHITLAAERCHVTQPSISSNLKMLEEQLGYKLFTRGSKGVEPTPAAEQLYPRAVKLLAEINDLSSLLDKQKTTLTLGLPLDLSPSRTSLLLKEIKLKLPNISLHLKAWNDQCDARITLDFHKKDSEVFIPLWEEDYLLCLPKEHELTKFDIVPPIALEEQVFMECPTCESHAQMAKMKTGNRRSIVIEAKADTKLQVLQLVKAGYGISFLPEGLMENETKVVSRALKAPRVFRRIGMAVEAKNIEDDVISQLIDVISAIEF
ncbi:LysR family transcriptional regulator [Vibrio alfacsensis]|uniref:LysR family transcriptional regulator n=1 Tax=Vibrio alfacsensis TaxID=1074311 RepID=UPI001BF125A6|nr:LysR family transcriptional regulator [Vibrio alfacsensis]BCN26291.1 LysR family transcriptional regulator [Vibrio alfacsensis]